MKTALFTNFSTTPFTGYWNGRGKTFAPGQSSYMPDYLAAHFAKHLTNRELLAKGLERSTSPKKPEEVSEFMELFNQAYTPDTTDEDMIQAEDGIDAQIAIANKNRQQAGDAKASMPISVPDPKPPVQNPNEPQMISTPDDDEEQFNQ